MSGSEQSIDDKRNGQPLLESEAHYQAMAEAATDAIITINSESTILLVNPAAEKIFGYSIEEMLGQPLTMLMSGYLSHVHRAGITRYLGTGQKHIERAAVQLPGLHKSGGEIPLEISFVQFIKGDQRFFTGIVRDVTERKRAEETQIRLVHDADSPETGHLYIYSAPFSIILPLQVLFLNGRALTCPAFTTPPTRD